MRSQFGTSRRAGRVLAPWIGCTALLLTGIAGAPAALAEPSASVVVPQFDLCPGDGTDGYRVQALFGYTSSPAELETFRAEIDAANQSVTNTFGLSSLERVTPGSPNGLEQVVRWNCAGDTLPDIKTFAAGDPATRDYSSVTNAAVGAGFNAADRDYVIYVAGWNDLACGRGGIPGTVTSPGARYSVVSRDCGFLDSGKQLIGATNHEVGHTLGPNHVWDAGGFTQTMARTGVICPTTAYEETFDCNYNDYYDPLLPSSMDPAVNVANSPYLTVPVVRPVAPPGDSYLSDLPAVTSTSGYGPVERDRSNGEAGAGDGNPLTLNGVVYPKGLGAQAFSEITYNLAGAYGTFTTDVGLDDEMTELYATIVFEVWVDGIKKFDSGVMSAPSPTQAVSLDVSGAQQLKLVITDAGDGITGDHGDWAGARLTTSSPPADRTTTTTLTSSPNPSLESQRVYLTAGVFGDCGPTGKVRLYVDGTRVRTFVLENGTPRFSARTLSVGTHTIRADYRGSATCDASTATVIQVVQAR